MRSSLLRHRCKHAATHLPPVGPPEAHAEVLCRRCQRYKHASVWSARRTATANDANSPKVRRREDQLATVQIKPDIFTLPCCTSAEMFFSCCDSAAALALANCNELVAEANISRPHPPIPSALCTAQNAREVRAVKSLYFPVRDTRARAIGISCLLCQTAPRSVLRLSVPPRPFSPAWFPPPGCFFARNCPHAGGPVR